MFGPHTTRVWAYPAPCDLRKGFNGLGGLVEHVMSRSVLGGDLFLFVNRRRTTAKMLYWDGTGMCILHKKLAEGTFPKLWGRADADPSGIELTTNELALFLEGCKLLETQKLSTEDTTQKWLAPPIQL
jgi:transposase